MNERLIRLIRDEQERIKKSLCENPLSEYTAYMRQVGKYEGLESALQFVLAQDKED